VTKLSTPHPDGRMAQIGPAVLGASSFACADVLVKVVLIAGAGVLTMSAIRAVVGVAMLFVWLKLVPPGAFSRRATWISLGLGVLFAGNVFLLFMAIEAVDVPIAILTYFVYPLLTGLAAAATRLEKITWRGAAAAFVAFLGLALMIGAHPTSLAGRRHSGRDRRRGLPGGDPAPHPCISFRRRSAAHHLVFALVLDRRVFGCRARGRGTGSRRRAPLAGSPCSCSAPPSPPGFSACSPRRCASDRSAPRCS